MIGRPTKLTSDVQNTIVAAIQRGAYIETAAALADISKDTFYDWLQKGKALRNEQKPVITAHDKNLIDFSDAIERAIAQSEMRDVLAIDQAAQTGAWQAAAWKLERKHYQRWGRKVAITDDQGGNFFAGMAKAWAAALEADQDDTPYINGSGQKLLNGGTNGSGG